MIKFITDYSKGGLVLGKPHSRGGVPTYADGGLVAEIEGGEFIIPAEDSEKLRAMVKDIIESGGSKEKYLKVGKLIYNAVVRAMKENPPDMEERIERGISKKVMDTY
jgi:hypothetical protein